MASEETERIEIILAARDRDLNRAIDRSNKLIAKFERDARRNTGRATREINRNLDRSAERFVAFGRAGAAALAALAASATTGAIRRTVRGIAEIGDQARRSGLGVDEFQALKFVAEQTRIPIDSLVDGMKELSLRGDEFVATGAGPAVESFQRLGLSAQDLAQQLHDPSELLLEIFKRMEDLDRAAQIRVADEIFGGTGGERFVELMAQGAGGIRTMMGQAREAGAILDSEVIQKADEIDKRFSAMTSHVGAALKALSLDVVQVGVNWADGIGAVVTPERDQAADGIHFAKSLLSEVQAINTALITTNQRSDQLAALAVKLRSVVRAFESGDINLDTFTHALKAIIEDGNTAVDTVAALDDIAVDGLISRINALAGALKTVATEAATVAAAIPAAVTHSNEPDQRIGEPVIGISPLAPVTSPRPVPPPNDIDFGVPIVPAGGGGAASGDSYLDQVARYRDEIAQLELEAAQLVLVAEGGRQLGDALEYARVKAELLYAAQKEGREVTPELAAEIDDLASSLVAVGAEADAAADKLARIQDNARRGADAMADLFYGILSGSMSAEDAVARLLAQIAQAQLAAAFNGMAANSPTGGFLSILGSLLSGGRASGGPVTAGQPYLVNENTANSEIFVPSQSGAVLNVPQAQAALSGSGGGGGGGRMILDIRVEEAPGFASQVKAQANAAAAEHISAYDQTLPSRVSEIADDPRVR